MINWYAFAVRSLNVDEGFGENVPVDVVIRPEDLYIFPVSEMAQLVGVVETSIFKGVHYEMTVLCGGYEFSGAGLPSF